jgi:DNA-binding CsgD family transcriptional regulator
LEVIGREAEFAVIDRLLQSVLDNHSQVLILRGEAGIGKSVFLDAVAHRAKDIRVLRATGVESEISMPFAGLHQLVWPITDHIDGLAGAPATTLRGALGLGGQAGSILSVGAALVSLLSAVAEEQPLLFLVDDAHCLDEPSASALAFAARRLRADPIGGLIAVREGASRDFAIPDIPVLDIKGLSVKAATNLFDELSASIAAPVRHHLIVETGGNPLALRELPAALSPAQLDGALPLPAWLPLPDRLVHAYRDRVMLLPVATQRLLLLAAADDWLELDILIAAAASLGASGQDLASAERAGLVKVEKGKVGFCHPLARSAVYQWASETDRLSAHRALAEALSHPDDHDRRAWHLASATVGTSEEAASALEAVADRIERRQGAAAAAAPMVRSADLTEDDSVRGRRLARAAGASLEAGQRERAQTLLAKAELSAQDPRVRAEILFCRGRLVMQTTASADADVQTLMEGARLVERSDPHLAARMLSLASYLGWFGRDWSGVTGPARRLLELRMAEDCLLKQRARDMINVLEGGKSLAEDYMDASSDALSQRKLAAEVWMPPPMIELAGAEATSYRVLKHAAQDLRETGAIWGLMSVLVSLGRVEYLLGQWSSSVEHLKEALALARETGHDFKIAICLGLLARIAAIKGDEDECKKLTDELQSSESTCSLVVCISAWALGLLDLGLGRGEEAFERMATMAPVKDWPDRNQVALRATGDLATAAVLSGRLEDAVLILDGLERWTGSSPPAWSQVILHRLRGRLAQDPQLAERHFQAAISVSGSEARPWEHARAELLYGQWLRRQKRKAEARIHLRAALQIFDQLGAEPWSERARTDLRATGERLYQDDDRALEHLTPQELQIARLAAQGLTNRQIGEYLFLSPSTVSTHLYRLFPKLGIASRSDLRAGIL